MDNRSIVAATAVALVLVTGCTPQARQDVDNAGSDLNAAAVHSATGTKKAIDKADEKAAVDAKAAIRTAEQKAAVADKAVAKDVDAAVQNTERIAAKASMDTKDTGALLTLTPKVKGAILLDDRVKIPDLNIDTKPAAKEVIVNGTASSETMKAEALADAKKELAKANSNYTLVDRLSVGKTVAR